MTKMGSQAQWITILCLAVGCGGDDSVAAGDASNIPDQITTDGGVDGSIDAAPAIPTVSSWVGTNISADLPRVDIAHQLSPFDTPAQQRDANGYPVAGASGTSSTDIGFVLPTGTYKIAFKGTGALQVSGIGKLKGAWVPSGGQQQSDLDITGTLGLFGNFLTLKIINGQGQTVQDIRILLPGFDYNTTPLFVPGFLGLLKPFRALRFMDWESTNGSTMTDWTSRPAASNFGSSPFGEPYEHIIELVNQTGKDCWLTIPEHASDDFIHQFAQFVRDHLDFGRIDTARNKQGYSTPFKLIIEDSNETWNNGFSAYKTYLDAANKNTARYTGKYSGTYGPSWMTGSTDLMKVGQFHADRLVNIATIFRQELSSTKKEGIVTPVLSGWALGAGFSDVGLRFIKDNYGDPKKQVSYVAIAPYFGPAEPKTGDLASLFASMGQDIASMDPAFQDFHKLAAEYGLEIVGYEGGQSITGNTNLTVKHLAQHDQRMYDNYNAFFTLWKKNFGESLFMHFSLAGDPGLPEFVYQYGFWGSIVGALEDPDACSPKLPTLTGTEMVSAVVHHCPKYRALREQVP